jgi:hypothetical protein
MLTEMTNANRRSAVVGARATGDFRAERWVALTALMKNDFVV